MSGGSLRFGDRSVLQQGLGLGFRIGIELVVAVVVATGLGWAIDRWLGTRPWGMIVLFFLGVAAGMLNVYRAVTGISGPVGYRHGGWPRRWTAPRPVGRRGLLNWRSKSIPSSNSRSSR